MYRDNETWDLWYRDFFKPAAPLLEAAPWIMVRGNHESCTFTEHKGPNGWFLFLDFTNDGTTRVCPAGNEPQSSEPFNKLQFSDPYGLDINKKLRLVIFDSAEAFNVKTKSDYEGQFEMQFKKTWPKLTKNAHDLWLLTHIPLWDEAEPSDTAWRELRDMLRAAYESRTAKERAVTTVISGDLHFFQLAQKAPSAEAAAPGGAAGSGDKPQPVQFVVGNSGVKLDPLPQPPIEGRGLISDPAGRTTVDRHGYLLACQKLDKDGQPVTPWRFFLHALVDGEWQIHPGVPKGWAEPARMPCELDGKNCKPLDESPVVLLKDSCY
jgi:hypothetical protein